MPEQLISSSLSSPSSIEDNDNTFAAKKKKSDEETAAKPLVSVHRSRSQAAGSRRVAPAMALATVTVGCVLSSSDAETETLATTSGSEMIEKHLQNGDLYIGSFSGNVPHGSGRYLWSDGCMYEGEWRKGKASGKGRFSWPSGATYEGEFRSGRMEGSGTFTGSAGDTYRGAWLGDRKHGYGEKHFSNGDYYEGMWKRNLHDGNGRYVWKNGNEYVGDWRNGVMDGRGVLIWANGCRYDGCWENGVSKGQGVYTWPDGGCYVGMFQPEQILNGTFYPGGKEEKLGFSHKVLDDGFVAVSTARKRSSVDGSRGSLTERSFPRICIWESDGEAGDITCDIIDNAEATMLYRDSMGLGRHEIRQFRRNPCWLIGGEEKKPGQVISKGHKNYELMLNLQLGIRHSVGKHSSITRDVKTTDFDPKEKFWTRFPPEGSKLTPPHQSGEFRWKDYCPNVFRRLRELFQVDPADYMLAICGNDALRELSSPGKSGSFFYLTQDDRFMIKTVKKSEVKVLIKMLPSYYQHVCRYENSLVTKFFGVHCVKPVGGIKTRFIVMGNLFCSEYRIHRRFDLKGSSHGRTTDKPEEEIDETTTLKDLDLNYVFRLQENWFKELIKQINRDCEFLEAERIMDYRKTLTMASSQMSLLIVSLLALTASTSAIPTIYDLVNQFGFPSGILPDSVESYSIAPSDGGAYTFAVYLKKPCYVKYDYLVHFESEITGKISNGQITELKGLKAQSLWFWLSIDQIKMDGSSLQFTLGLLTVKSDISFFEAIPTCKDKALAACDQSTNKLISQLPLKLE